MTPEQWASARIVWLTQIVDREHYKINPVYRTAVDGHVRQLVEFVQGCGMRGQRQVDMVGTRDWQEKFSQEHEQRFADLLVQLERHADEVFQRSTTRHSENAFSTALAAAPFDIPSVHAPR